jgi:PAS domain S-box-containing protein
VARLAEPVLSTDDYRLLVESVHEYAIALLDAEGRVVTWNRAAQRMTGHAAADVIGKDLSFVYPPEEVARGKPGAELAEARMRGRFAEECVRVRRDGSHFWADVVITPLYERDGTLRGFGKIMRDSTAQRTAHEQLQRSEERFRSLVEAARDYAIYMLDEQGRVATWNPGAERTHGFRAEEIIGGHFSVFFLPEDARAQKPAAELAQARAQGRFEEEGWRMRKDGSRFWASVVLTPVYDAHGVLAGYAKVTRDLTTRLEVEEHARALIRAEAARTAAEASEARIRESEARYRALSHRLEVILEGIADGVTVQDSEGSITFANTAAAEASGFATIDQFLNASHEDQLRRFRMFDDDGQPLDPALLPGRRVLAGEPQASALIQVREEATGRTWWTQIRSTAVLDSEGKPELAINVFHDVTAERRRMLHEQYLAQATATLSASLDYQTMLSTLANLLAPGLGDWCVVHLLEDGVLNALAVVHAQPEKVRFAREMATKYPTPPDAPSGAYQVVRTGKSELYPELPDTVLVTLARNEEHLKMAREIGIRSVIIVPMRARDRILGTITLVAAESGRRYDEHDLTFLEELGRRAGGAVENAQLYTRAQEAARLEAGAARRAEEASRVKDEFLATVSHELRTPLNAILGWSSLLLQRAPDSSQLKGLEVIHRNARTQAKIIDDILDVSRIITGKLRLEPKPADLVQIVRDAMEVIRPSALAKRIHVELVTEGEACLLVADPERLQQVTWNLLSNAVKFTDPGGTIKVRLRHEGARLSLQVSDTGRGIAPEFLPFVFDRFKQADSSTTRRVGGLGLGLAIVRHIVELHGGQASAHSEGLGRGATFTVTLPVRAVVPPQASSESHAEFEARTPLVSAGSLRGVKVLVVDDEADARDLLQTVLTEAGANVETAGSAVDGLAKLLRFRPHVLVSDIGMPEMDGYQLIERVKALPEEQGGGVAAIALTAYTRQVDKSKALALGFAAHLGKPVNPNDLLAAVAALANAPDEVVSR